MKLDKAPTESYADIGGLENQIQEVREAVELPLLHPELYEEMGIKPPKGVILYGGPGTGKTLLAKAVANQTSATFLRIVGSELIQKYLGDGPRLVRQIFQVAAEHAPSIVFIDEIDAIGTKRYESTSGGEREVQRTMLELLNQLDGFDDRGDVKVILATNKIDTLDPALIRPGRIDRKILFENPDQNTKRKIFNLHTSKMSLNDDVELDEFINQKDDLSGADIKAICSEAGLMALRERRMRVQMADFRSARERVLKTKSEVNTVRQTDGPLHGSATKENKRLLLLFVNMGILIEVCQCFQSPSQYMVPKEQQEMIWKKLPHHIRIMPHLKKYLRAFAGKKTKEIVSEVEEPYGFEYHRSIKSKIKTALNSSAKHALRFTQQNPNQTPCRSETDPLKIHVSEGQTTSSPLSGTTCQQPSPQQEIEENNKEWEIAYNALEKRYEHDIDDLNHDHSIEVKELKAEIMKQQKTKGYLEKRIKINDEKAKAVLKSKEEAMSNVVSTSQILQAELEEIKQQRFRDVEMTAEELARQTRALDQARREVEARESSIRQLSEEIDYLKAHKLEMHAQTLDLRGDSIPSEIRNELDPEYVNSVQTRVELLLELQRARYTLGGVQNILDSTDRAVAERDEYIYYLRAETEGSPAKIAVIDGLLRLKDQNFAGLQNRAAECANAFTKLENQQKEDKKKHKIAQENMEKKLSLYNDQTKCLEKRLRDCEEQRSKTINMLQRNLYRDDILEYMNDEFAALQENNFYLSSELQKKVGRIGQLIDATSQLEQSLSDQTHTVESNGKEIESFKEKIHHLEVKVENLESQKSAEADISDQDLRTKDAEIKRLSDRINQLDEWNEKLRTESPDEVTVGIIRAKDQSIENLELDKARLTKEKENLSAKLCPFENGDLKRGHDHWLSMYDIASDQLIGARHHICNLQEQLRILRPAADPSKLQEIRTTLATMVYFSTKWKVIEQMVRENERKIEDERQILGFEKYTLVSNIQNMWLCLGHYQDLLCSNDLFTSTDGEIFEELEKKVQTWLNNEDLPVSSATHTYGHAPLSSIEQTAEYREVQALYGDFGAATQDEQEVRQAPPAEVSAMIATAHALYPQDEHSVPIASSYDADQFLDSLANELETTVSEEGLQSQIPTDDAQRQSLSSSEESSIPQGVKIPQEKLDPSSMPLLSKDRPPAANFSSPGRVQRYPPGLGFPQSRPAPKYSNSDSVYSLISKPSTALPCADQQQLEFKFPDPPARVPSDEHHPVAIKKPIYHRRWYGRR
ncbi:MAG: hypothetical protein Q9214_001471 [Letrouitia sp. 1 TL-2023]